MISVIAWMAGMLYLPRLYVYHCAAEIGSVQSETFKVMERRLLRGIINPAMILTWMFGILLAIRPGFDLACRLVPREARHGDPAADHPCFLCPLAQGFRA